MKRIYPAFAYSEAPRAGCWWDETCAAPDRVAQQGDAQADVVIIGGGFTGLNATLHLAQAGVGATVLEAERVGFGASGRNGGFCCLGGGMLEDATLDRKFGREGRLGWRQAELAAIRQVEDFITTHDVDVDRHSQGETQLAHRPRDFDEMRGKLDHYAENYGVTARLTEKADLAAEGLNAGFEGAITVPIGFGLNPRKYVTALAEAAEEAGATVYHNSPALNVTRRDGAFDVTTPKGRIRAERVIIATNGYSSEDLPPWLSARYMPTQSSVIVTRTLTEAELAAQGWTSQQASYDSRHLLHYFRLMPDNRMLFGVRGGLLSNPASEARALRRARADFEAMFPAWRNVETPHGWSGMVCIARNRMPFVGEVPDQPGMFAGLCYHGNGVAMASYSGALLADLVRGKTPERPYPAPMRGPLARFELGRFRRAVMPFVYAGFALSDR